MIQERERGDHTIGAIWRRAPAHLPDREQLGSYVLQVLDPGLQDYIEFHVRTIACAFCQANLTDLQTRQKEAQSHSSRTPPAHLRFECRALAQVSPA